MELPPELPRRERQVRLTLLRRRSPRARPSHLRHPRRRPWIGIVQERTSDACRDRPEAVRRRHGLGVRLHFCLHRLVRI